MNAMKKGIFFFFLMFSLHLMAQTPMKKVYDETLDPMAQIDEALQKAKSSGKYVVCQLGGNWCSWCLRFAQFVTSDEEIHKVIDDNFVFIHVNYSRRASEQSAQTPAMLKRLGNPVRFGFPVFVVLDAKGKVIHTQDSSFLEEGSGYSKDKVLRFFNAWTPKACEF